MNKIDQIAVESVDSVTTPDSGFVTLSTGVVLLPRAVSALIFSEFQKRNKRPNPPMFFNKENGRNEVNPNDPEYISAIREWELNMALGLIDTMILMGTSLEHVPDVFPKVEDTDWVDDLEVIGITVPDNKRARYLAYVKYVAAPTNDDTQNIMKAVSRLSGVSEEDVDAAVTQFRPEDK